MFLKQVKYNSIWNVYFPQIEICFALCSREKALAIPASNERKIVTNTKNFI